MLNKSLLIAVFSWNPTFSTIDAAHSLFTYRPCEVVNGMARSHAFTERGRRAGQQYH